MNYLFTIVLAAILAAAAYFGAKNPKKRGLVMIAAGALAAADIWRVQSPNLSADLAADAPLAHLATITIGPFTFGSLDIATACALAAALMAVGMKPWRAVLCQLVALVVGVAILLTAHATMPEGTIMLPGTIPLVVAFAICVLDARHEWFRISRSDRQMVAVLSAICALVAVAGIHHMVA